MFNALTDLVAREFGTPTLVVDLEKLERNIRRVQDACTSAGLANRPHIKTHKSPAIAAMQRDAGARGITCQKLGEAEVMADAGFDDILISYNILGDEKIARLAALRRRVEVTVAADNSVTVEALARAAKAAERPIAVVIECDTGRRRAGVETAAEAVTLARRVAEQPGLDFAGFLLYPPEGEVPLTQRFLDEALAGVRAHGLEARIVSGGGTPNLKVLGQIKGVTEHRAGTYVFNDRMTMAAKAATLDDCALTVVTTVVSRASRTRGILDAGSKTLTTDKGGLSGHGLIVEHPDAAIGALAEEHGFLDLSACSDPPPVGAVVSVVPNHVCPVVNLFDRLVATRRGAVVGEIAVAARGRVR